MSRRFLALTVALAAILLNLIIPACGSKNETGSPYATAQCLPGVACTGVTGTPLTPYPILTAIDSYGSMAQIMIYSTGTQTGGYSGQVTVQAQVYMSPYQQYCPPGNYAVQGTGSFQANYGGTLGLVQSSMTGSSGFTVQLSGEVYQGQDPFQTQATQFYYMGSFANSCDSHAVGE